MGGDKYNEAMSFEEMADALEHVKCGTYTAVNSKTGDSLLIETKTSMSEATELELLTKAFPDFIVKVKK